MKVVSVIPITKGFIGESLSYFTLNDVPPGTLVSVPLRQKKIDALVVETLDLAEAKSIVKSSGFSLKKVEMVKGPLNLNPNFINALLKIKDYFASPAGTIFAAVLPKIFWENYHLLNPRTLRAPKFQDRSLLVQKMILQDNLDERLSFYKTFVRESFAQKKSILICLPKAKDVDFFAEILKKGIGEYIITFHGELPKKEFVKRYNRLATEEHPMLILATPSYLFTVPGNLSAIILERESSSAYRQLSRPYVDFRTFAEILAAELGVKIIFADTLLRVETLMRQNQLEVEELRPISFRTGGDYRRKLIDLSTSQKEGKTFRTLSPELIETIKKSPKQERSFLFVLRKGLAPVTYCNDCGRAFVCQFCDKPMILYENVVAKRVYMCHFCRTCLDAEIKCQICQSWNLRPLGVGTETVVKELEQFFPKSKIFRLDKEIAKTPKQAAKIVAKFYDTSGAILVGTELALHYLREPVGNTAIVSFDSLWSIPDFKMGEKIIHLLLQLGDLADRSLIIQTKNKDDYALKNFMTGNLADFVREELAHRQKLNYPPFSRFIKITFRGTPAALANVENIIRCELKNYNPKIYKAYTPKIKNNYILNALIQVEKKDWSLPELLPGGKIDSDLLAHLRALPPACSIQIDPDDLL